MGYSSVGDSRVKKRMNLTVGDTGESMRVLILERDHSGHRFTVVKVLLDALLDLNNSEKCLASITLATTSDALHSDEFRLQLYEYQHLFNVELLSPFALPAHPVLVAWRKLQDWRKLVCGGRYDHVYVPYGDGLVQALGTTRFIPRVFDPGEVVAETIFMRGSFGYPHSRLITKMIALLGVRFAPFGRIHLIDPLPFEYLQKSSIETKSKVRLLPDPITTTPQQDRRKSRIQLNLELEVKWIGCVGQIDERKGIDLLIRTFHDAIFDSEVRLLLAGKHSKYITELLMEHSSSRIVSIDRYLDEQEFVSAISALDVVVTPYPHFVGSASIVLRAAAANRYCLAANTGWMGKIVPEMQLGQVCDVTNPDEFKRSLGESIEASEHYSLGVRGQQFMEYGSSKNIHAHWTQMLRKRLGLPADSNLQDWPM